LLKESVTFESGLHVNRNIIVIGASAGGVEAVPRLLSSLSANIPAAFFVTLHIPPYSESSMPKLITRKGSLPAEHPRDLTPIRNGRVYVAPPDYHLMLDRELIRLSHGPKENRHRPAIDPLFRSAAKIHAQRVAGVLLTGNLDDGVAGLAEIQERGGLAIVQDPIDASFPDMPRNALHSLEPDHCLSLAEIEKLLGRVAGPALGGSKMKANNQNSKPSPQDLGVPPKNGVPAPFTCPECSGPMWEFHQGKTQRFQCLVGHRYTLENLLAAHADELETALWVALRVLEERINLQRRLAQQSNAAGRRRGMQLFQARVVENETHAKLLRKILEELKH
jgi:two-component system chemotaxis response regulator CheB